jgi:hypothetical protein
VSARHPDAIGAALITLAAVAVIAAGLTTPDPGFGVVSPGTFPVVLGVLMLVSGIWLALDTLRERRELQLEPLDRGPFAATAVAAAAFLAAFVPLGFVISGTAFLVAQSRILGSRAMIRDAIASLVFVLAVYWLFVGFLTVDLPNGPLPF